MTADSAGVGHAGLCAKHLFAQAHIISANAKLPLSTHWKVLELVRQHEFIRHTSSLLMQSCDCLLIWKNVICATA